MAVLDAASVVANDRAQTPRAGVGVSTPQVSRGELLWDVELTPVLGSGVVPEAEDLEAQQVGQMWERVATGRSGDICLALGAFVGIRGSQGVGIPPETQQFTQVGAMRRKRHREQVHRVSFARGVPARMAYRRFRPFGLNGRSNSGTDTPARA